MHSPWATGVVVEVLGFAAGATIMVSAVPQLVANIRNPQASANQSITRNIALVAGNIMWVAYGLMINAPSITMMCVVAAVLNGAVAMQVFCRLARASSVQRANVAGLPDLCGEFDHAPVQVALAAGSPELVTGEL
jgi:uncharacterized protein with PQ loop repeat